MIPKLIVNADDFGLTHGVNRAIAELHDAGALTSATLMARGAAFKDAVALAQSRPKLGIGCHVVLTDGVPTSLPKTIPSLLSRDGRTLRPKLYSFLAAALTNQIDSLDVEREAIAQIQHIQKQGLRVTHIDTHKHTHLLPQVLKPLLRAALKTGVKAIRNPFEQPWAIQHSRAPRTRHVQLRLVQALKTTFLQQPEIRSGQVRTTEGTIGVSATGTLDQSTLTHLLEAMPEGTWELVCHPGYNDQDLSQVVTRLRSSREVERSALLSTLSSRLPNSRRGEERSDGEGANPFRPELIHYGSLM